MRNETLIGRELRRLREEKEMTVDDLARKAIIPAQTLYALENGRTKYPREDRLRRLAAVLDTDFTRLSLLVYGVGQP